MRITWGAWSTIRWIKLHTETRALASYSIYSGADPITCTLSVYLTNYDDAGYRRLWHGERLLDGGIRGLRVSCIDALLDAHL